MTKVLVVDDDTDLLDMVSLVLTRYNMKVNPLDKCLEFLDTLTSDIPDIVLMDIYLGECDGRELCQNLKKASPYSNIPVILYSAGNVTQSSVHESLADDFMAKPFDIQHLVNKIRHHLDARKQ
jgi:DNA-binding response OmpR family regulator